MSWGFAAVSSSGLACHFPSDRRSLDSGPFAHPCAARSLAQSPAFDSSLARFGSSNIVF